MNSYLIKVLWTGPEVVFCDLKVNPSNNLFDLHQAIAKEFGLKGETLAEVAREFTLGDYLLLGEGELWE